MELGEYQKKSRTTAIYPNAGENIIYPALGLCGEVAETLEKLLQTPYDEEAIKKELGDVLWYVSQLCSELKINLAGIHFKGIEFTLMNNLSFEEELVVQAGKIAEVVKKTLRDKEGVCDNTDEEKITECLVVVMYCLDAIIDDAGDVIENVARINIEKLFSRKARGKLKGSGDDR